MSSRRAISLIGLLLISTSSATAAQRAGEPVMKPVPLGSPTTLQPRWDTRRLDSRQLVVAASLSTSLAATSGMVGGATGLLLGYGSCAERDKDFMLSPLTCLFYNKGMLYGAYTGWIAGAGLGAGSGAIRAGCRANEAWKRSFLGSLAGSLPALAYLAAGGSGSEDVQNGFLIGGAILPVVGATAAVSGCRVLQRS